MKRTMPRPLPPLLLLLALVAAAVFCLGASPATAAPGPEDEDEDPAPGDEQGPAEAPAGADGEASPLVPADDKVAKTLADEIARASKKKDASEVLAALERIAKLAHEDFDKSLLRLLKHDAPLVALKAAEMWDWRVTAKNASKVWSAAYAEKANDRRYLVKTRTLRAFARAGVALGERQFKEIERDWRWIVGNPNPALGPALAWMAEWAAVAKDKRLCRELAEGLDEPQAENPNSPTNPPAEWWERRWKLWKESKPAVVSALKAITGQEFDKTQEAKAWFETNQRTFGFKW